MHTCTYKAVFPGPLIKSRRQQQKSKIEPSRSIVVRVATPNKPHRQNTTSAPALLTATAPNPFQLPAIQCTADRQHALSSTASINIGGMFLSRSHPGHLSLPRSPDEAPVMIHVFFPPAADIIINWPVTSCDKRSAAAAFPTCVRAPTAAGAKLPGPRDTAAAAAATELAWLTRVKEPRAVDIGPRNPTTVCSRHARHSTALSAPEEVFPRIMVVVWLWLLA